MARVHQIDLETTLFEDLIERNPIDAGRLHGYRLYPTTLQPVGHPMQVSCKTLKPAYWLVISIRRHGDVMRTVPHINSRSMRMNHLQAWLFGLQSSRPLLSLLSLIHI